jgi:hypothetical protein
MTSGHPEDRGPGLPEDLPTHHVEAAELVRRHLVVLRGGVLFLSSRDGAALVKWLDDGVPVARILYALEIAAERRRRRSDRAPLQLTHASRYLGRERVVEVDAPAPAVLADADAQVSLLAWLDQVGRPLCAERFPARFAALRHQVGALSTRSPRALAAQVIGLLAEFQGACWEDLGDDGRAPYEQAALAGLGDLADLFAEDEIATLTEEHARGLFRAGLVGLDAAAVLRVVGL